jgi:hypothetical protein
MCFLFVCLSFIGGAVLFNYLGSQSKDAAIKAAYEARDFAYKNFNDARVEYKKLKAGVRHDLDKVLNVF